MANSNVVVRSNWGSIAATIDPNVFSPGIAISVLAGDPINMRRLFASIFGSNTSTVMWRILVLRGQLPPDTTQLAAWDSVNGVPANSGIALGLDVQWEAVVPVNSLIEENLTDEDITGPIAIAGQQLIALVVPLVTGPGLQKAYIALSAYGGPANPTQNDRQYRALPRFPQSFSDQPQQ